MHGNYICHPCPKCKPLLDAAPDMLEALKAIIENGNVDCGTYWKIDIDDIKQARAAIAKAEGR